MQPSTPKEFFDLGALRRECADCFTGVWKEPIQLTREFCEKHTLAFRWDLMAFILLTPKRHKYFLNNCKDISEEFQQCRLHTDAESYKKSHEVITSKIMGAFITQYESQQSAPAQGFLSKCWDWLWG